MYIYIEIQKHMNLKEQVKLLRSSIYSWNNFRVKHPEFIPNLEYTILRNVDLRGANLERANLQGADLEGANLQDATLEGANLQDADFSYANLEYTILKNANLQGTNLKGADLERANFEGSNLEDANLEEIKEDILREVSKLKTEVPNLIKHLKEGKVDGSLYEGDCACLAGTLANSLECHYRELPNGYVINSDSLRERWFLGIKRGDTVENNPISRLTVKWLTDHFAV